MPLLRPFFQLFWVACCAITLLAQTRLLLGLSLTPDWLDGFVFCGTVFGYHCTHPNTGYRILAWGMGVIGGLCFLILFMALSPRTGEQLIFLAPVLVWLAYYGFQRPGNSGLRGHLFAKPLTVALAWTWVTVVLPTSPVQWEELPFLFLGRAAFIFALALAYDLSDLEYDRDTGLDTLTGKLGTNKSFLLIYCGLAVAGACVLANACLGVYDFSKAIGLFASLLFSAWWLRYLLQQDAWKPWQKPLIDGLMVLQFLLVLLFSSLF